MVCEVVWLCSAETMVRSSECGVGGVGSVAASLGRINGCPWVGSSVSVFVSVCLYMCVCVVWGMVWLCFAE